MVGCGWDCDGVLIRPTGACDVELDYVLGVSINHTWKVEYIEYKRLVVNVNLFTILRKTPKIIKGVSLLFLR